ncbi:hypothetical protein Zmor_011755 [Zophobas morio]|jgi:hypothetical protein|uniref:Uncharacterized protein n=1 Tax=Zophobas morio TaxID=2755281 RepID=A0AA38LYT0_9CUCU|nr:hypothetical protein Zmor_011755 [Zophobas morio]
MVWWLHVQFPYRQNSDKLGWSLAGCPPAISGLVLKGFLPLLIVVFYYAEWNDGSPGHIYSRCTSVFGAVMILLRRMHFKAPQSLLEEGDSDYGI